jgi:hypothetical protein
MRQTLLLLSVFPLLTCGGRAKRAAPDSAFAALQQRGETAMSVNQYTSQHVFEPLPNGGRIVLQRKEPDSVGEAAIRTHMRTIASAFSAGNFTLPAFVHAMADVPGTATMSRLKAEITYTAHDVPRGGEVTIATKNPEAVTAIHDFLAFQRMDHRAGMH